MADVRSSQSGWSAFKGSLRSPSGLKTKGLDPYLSCCEAATSVPWGPPPCGSPTYKGRGHRRGVHTVRLRLILHKCDIGAEGAKATAGALCRALPPEALSLPASLEHLELDLSSGAYDTRPWPLDEALPHWPRGGCESAGGHSFAMLGPCELPRALRDLELVLLRCGIGAKGAKASPLDDLVRWGHWLGSKGASFLAAEASTAFHTRQPRQSIRIRS